MISVLSLSIRIDTILENRLDTRQDGNRVGRRIEPWNGEEGHSEPEGEEEKKNIGGSVPRK